MATTKPRITVTLDPAVHETLKGLAELQGVSMSSIVSDLLLTVEPVQRRVLNTLRHAFILQGNARTDFADQLERAQEKVASLALPLLESLDSLSGSSLPPHSNTGVTNFGSVRKSSESPLKTSACDFRPQSRDGGVE